MPAHAGENDHTDAAKSTRGTLSGLRGIERRPAVRPRATHLGAAPGEEEVERQAQPMDRRRCGRPDRRCAFSYAKKARAGGNPNPSPNGAPSLKLTFPKP